MSSPKMSGSKKPSTSTSKRLPDPDSDLRPYNHYNMYFILERELFLQERGVPPTRDLTKDTQVDYSTIDLPALPPRYANTVLQREWYVNKKKKRSHKKSHGLISFKEMADMVSARWKAEGDEVKDYVRTVAERVKERYDEHRLMGQYSSCFSHQGVSPSPREQDLDDGEDLLGSPSVQDRLDTMARLLQGISSVDSCPQLKPRPVYSHHEVPISSERVATSSSCGRCACGDCTPSSSRSSPVAELDVTDDEILSMWSTAPHDQQAHHHRHRYAM